LAQVLFVSQSDQAKVPSLLEECLAVSTGIGFKQGIAASFGLTGQLALGQGDLVTARSLTEKSVVLYKEMGHQHGTAESLSALGKVLAAEGDYAAAQAVYKESLVLSEEFGEKWMIAACLVGLGNVVAAQRQLAWGVQLWGAAEAIRDAFGIPIPPVERADYERSVSSARVHLGEKAFAAWWNEGRTMTPKQAFAARGQRTISPPTTPQSALKTYPSGLTAREVEVLRLVAGGLTNSQIAQALDLSEKTVATHLTHIFNKTTSENRASAAAFAIHNGLV
jgi:DNA-binding CsgD family transcriptional regulator